MEVEISNLQARLNDRSSSSTAHDEQVVALEQKLDKSERAAKTFQQELADLKKSLERTSERAVKEGSQRSSAETKIRDLERELSESRNTSDELRRRCEGLEKKVLTLTTLHKEAEARHQTGQKERDRFEKEAAELRRRLASTDGELKTVREQQSKVKRKGAEGDDSDGIEELEDEGRQKLQARVRELEGELFELRRGMWRRRRTELGSIPPDSEAVSPMAGGSRFDDVDLGGSNARAQSPRRGLGIGQGATFSNILSGGFSALTGNGGAGAGGGPAAAGLEFQDDDDFEGFDEDAFRRAQEEEARKRVERVKEAKKKLKQWEGWRLDLVESRAGGGGHGEIFEV